jgi:hypothetical protein
MTDLGKAVKRDPDALAPRNGFEMAMNWIYRAAVGIGGGNMLFALKAGALTGQPLALHFYCVVWLSDLYLLSASFSPVFPQVVGRICIL